MRAITVQHKDVLKQLQTNGSYVADINNVKYDNLKNAYEFMMRAYGYRTCPIFLAPVGHKVEFYGASFDEDHVAIEFDIPEDRIRIQKYYDWTDFVYFLEYQDEFYPSIYSDVYEFGNAILVDTTTLNEWCAYQITVDELRRDWIVDTTGQLDRLDHLHNGSGGQNILNELSFYKGVKNEP